MFKNVSNKVLENVKIVDFSRVLAAPMTSMILGDLGAEIWKIEKPGVGDETRSWVPPQINEQSCYFVSVNRNKKSIALNLANPEGQLLAKKLAMKADVLLENFKTGNMKKFGLDYDAVRELNRGLVYCSITGYGSHGPYANDPGYDVIAEAVGGFIGTTGTPTGEPVKAAVAVTDMITGLYAHGAILAALMQRARTGLGQHIECNLLASQIVTMMNLASNYLNSGLVAKPLGTQHESIVPYQAFKTADHRYYVVGAGNDRAFAKLCERLELAALVEDVRFKSNKDRVLNRVALLEIIQKRFLEKPFAHWTKVLRSQEFPSGPVNTIKEAFEHPQVEALGLVRETTHPVYGKVKVVGPPVEFSTIENDIQSPPPLLGEHTVQILQKHLGLSDEKLAELKKKGVVDFPE